MQEKDIEKILQKVEELKAIFTFGVKFVPFLEDLLRFVQEMAPMLSEMNRSILDSSAKMPKAAQHLDEVTIATETATQEMLDKVDDLLAKVDEITQSIQKVNQHLTAEKETIAEITSSIEELLKLPEARKTLSKVFEHEKARLLGIKIKDTVDNFLKDKVDDELSSKVDQLLGDIQSDAYDIMNALQVQDITSQQIESAHSMLRSIQERLNDLIIKYSEVEPPSIIREEKAFDAGASYFDREERQKAADELIEGAPAGVETQAVTEKEEEAPEEGAGLVESQEEIDALFAESTQEQVAADEQGRPESEAFDDYQESVQSQQEIDELLSQGLKEETTEAEAEVSEFAMEEEPETGVEEAGETAQEVEGMLEEETTGEVEEKEVEQEPEAAPAEGEEIVEEQALEETGETAEEEKAAEQEAGTVVEKEEVPEEESPEKAEDKQAEATQEPEGGESGEEKPDGQISISQEEIDKLFE